MAALCAAALLVLGSGCSHSDTDQRAASGAPAPGAGSSTGPASATGVPSAALGQPVAYDLPGSGLAVVDDSAPGPAAASAVVGGCSVGGTPPAGGFGLWPANVIAGSAVNILSVRPVGAGGGAKVVGADTRLVRHRDPATQPGVRPGIAPWSTFADKTQPFGGLYDWKGRQAATGAALSKGDKAVLLVHLTGRAPMTLRALKVTYRSGIGVDTVTIPVSFAYVTDVSDCPATSSPGATTGARSTTGRAGGQKGAAR